MLSLGVCILARSARKPSRRPALRGAVPIAAHSGIRAGGAISFAIRLINDLMACHRRCDDLIGMLMNLHGKDAGLTGFSSRHL